MGLLVRRLFLVARRSLRLLRFRLLSLLGLLGVGFLLGLLQFLGGGGAGDDYGFGELGVRGRGGLVGADGGELVGFGLREFGGFHRDLGGGITQLGPVLATTLSVTAGGDVLLNRLAGVVGINQITNLGAVNMTGAGSDFVLFDQGGGLNLTASIGSSGGVKIVTTGGMTVNGIVNVATGAPLSITGDDTPAGYGMVLLANHNSVPGIVGGPNNFQVQTGSFSATGSLGVIYVDTQSASTLGNFFPLNFSPNTVFVGTTNNNLNFVNAGSTQWVLGIAGPLEVNDQAGQLNIDDLFKKLMEMADPARAAGLVTVDKGRRKQLNALMAAFKQSRSKGVIDPFSFGPLQFLGYDFQDLMEAGYGTPAYDPSKVGNETPKSILDGLPLTNQ